MAEAQSFRCASAIFEVGEIRPGLGLNACCRQQRLAVDALPGAHRLLNLIGVAAVTALTRDVGVATVAGGADEWAAFAGDSRVLEAAVLCLGAEDVHRGQLALLEELELFE